MNQKEKTITFVAISFVLLVLIYAFMNITKPALLFLSIFPILLIGFNFYVRGEISFRKYFTSRWNFLNSKYTSEIHSPIPKELFFEKVLEVLKDMDFPVLYSNPETFVILARKRITWSFWGENIYIDFADEGEITKMNFTSTTILGTISWGQNEKNYQTLISSFEESLTI